MYQSNTFEKYLWYFSVISPPPFSLPMRKTLLTTRVFGPITIVFFFLLLFIRMLVRHVRWRTCNRVKRPVGRQSRTTCLTRKSVRDDDPVCGRRRYWFWIGRAVSAYYVFWVRAEITHGTRVTASDNYRAIGVCCRSPWKRRFRNPLVLSEHQYIHSTVKYQFVGFLYVNLYGLFLPV